jgi:dCTP deaminase
MIKNDIWIKKMALSAGMIEPFEPAQIREGRISYGVSSYGYDFRLWDEFWCPRHASDMNLIDPKQFSQKSLAFTRTTELTLPPNSHVMARSLEYFRIPRSILAICTGKSTYARCGILVNITPLEPSWEGHVTFSIFNVTPLSVRIYPEEGIAQALFLEGPAPEVSYADRKGKYQAQKGLTLPKV